MRSTSFSIGQSNGIAFCAAMLAIFAVVYWSSADDDTVSPDVGTIRVVAAGQGPAPVAISPQSTASPAAVPPVQALEAAVASRFPMLRDATVQCQGQDCQLSASLPPPTSDREQDDRQAMLQGDLDRFLAAQGYPPSGPAQMDEIGDDEYRIRMTLGRIT